MTQNQPLHTLRDGRLKAALWENSNADKEAYYTVTLSKLYEDRNGKLQETSSFSASELLRISELAREAHGIIRDIRRDRSLDRQQTASQEQGPSRGSLPSRFAGRKGPSMDM